MKNQKMDNELNLALGASKEELERSETLAVGYDSAERTWKVIVKHSQPLTGLSELGVKQTELLNQYSILTVPESKLKQVSSLPQVEYMEKPKRLYFAVNEAKAASCIPYVQVEGSSYSPYLTGRGCLVAVIDSGEGVIWMPRSKKPEKSRVSRGFCLEKYALPKAMCGLKRLVLDCGRVNPHHSNTRGGELHFKDVSFLKMRLRNFEIHVIMVEASKG